jgi:hypothetical protein
MHDSMVVFSRRWTYAGKACGFLVVGEPQIYPLPFLSVLVSSSCTLIRIRQYRTGNQPIALTCALNQISHELCQVQQQCRPEADVQDGAALRHDAWTSYEESLR